MKNVLLIINPVAGRIKVKAALFDIVKTFCEANYNLTVQTTLRRGHAIELAASAEANGFDLVCCCGGDGTLNEVITGLVQSNSNIALGYIPAGSTNDFADTLKLPTVPKDAAQRIVNGKEFQMDIGSFNQNRNFTYIASFGAFTDVSYNAPQDIKNRLGYLAYILAGAKDIKDLRSHKLEYTVDGQNYGGKYIFGAIANTTRFAGIINLKKDFVNLQDGYFELLMIHMPKDLIELGEIINGITFSDFSSPLFEFMKINEIELQTPKSLNWTLDGEKAEGSSNISIKVLHNALCILK